MKDELIKQETALLAKKKGFDWQCKHYYQDSSRAGVFEISPYITNKIVNELLEEDKFSVISCAVATQSLLQRWLREVHNIHFIIVNIQNSNDYELSVVRQPGHILYDLDIRDSYEEALEQGLLYALNLI